MAPKFIFQLTQSQCGESLELESREPISDTPPHRSCHPKGIDVTMQFWLEEHSNLIRGCETLPAHKRNHTNCLDPWRLGKSAWGQKLGRIESVFCIMRWCLSVPAFPKNVIPVVPSILVITVSPYNPPAHSLCPLTMYFCISPTNFPLPNRLVVVAQTGSSHLNGLQVYL